MSKKEEIEVNHTQWLNQKQNEYVDRVQWAFRNKRKSFIAKTKAVQMIIDYCMNNNINPEDTIK